VSKFNPSGKKSRPVVVTSRKQLKTERRLANEYGKQAQAARRIAEERAEELEQAIRSSSDLHAIGAAAREAAWSEQRKNEAAMGSFRRKHQDVEIKITPKSRDTVVAREVEEGRQAHAEVEDQFNAIDSDPEGQLIQGPEITVTTDWAAEDDGWYTPEAGWKNAIFRKKNNTREVLNCAHKHKTPDAARACALKAASRRNNSSVRVMDGWTADARYPWTDGAVTALIDELRAEETPSAG